MANKFLMTLSTSIGFRGSVEKSDVIEGFGNARFGAYGKLGLPERSVNNHCYNPQAAGYHTSSRSALDLLLLYTCAPPSHTHTQALKFPSQPSVLKTNCIQGTNII